MISLQVSQGLMDEFDIIRKKLGFSSRSEALRQSIDNFIREHHDETPTQGHKIANITVHHEIREDILDKLTEIEAKYENLIKTINHYYLKSRVLKTITVAGPADEINELFNTLSADRLFRCTITYIFIPEKTDSEEESD